MDGGSCQKFRLSTATASNKSRPAKSGSIAEWKLAQQSQAALRQPIPRSLGDLIVDPNDMLSRVGVMNPKAFWQWYHLPDRGDPRSSVWLSRADSLWGEALWPYILQDELVLSTSIPIILEKAAAYTGRDYTKSKRVAAFNAITSVRYNFTHPGACSFGGLAIALSGMTHLAIQKNDYPAAFSHLNAITRLLRVYQLEPTEWLCCAWSDLRTVSAVGESPRLPRSLPARWERSLPLSIASLQSCQDLASRNVCACKQALGGQIPMAYAIFRRLHELQHALDVDQYAKVTPMAEVYEATYEACELHAIARIAGGASGATYQMELIAIALKLCAWERCAKLIPRCGDIERRLVGRALEILIGNWPEAITEWKASASIQVLLWVLLATTATAYAHVPEKWQSLLALCRVVIVTEKSTTWSSLCSSLKSWPCAHWWFTPVLRKILEESSPSKSSWQVLDAEDTGRQPAGFLKCLVFGD